MLALPGVQWKPSHVFLTQGTHVELLEKCVADSTVPIDVGIPKQAPPPDGVDWALFDGRPTRAMLQLCALAGIRRLVSLKPLRTNMGQWHSIHLNLVHHAVGGITTAHRRVFFHWDERRFFPSGLLPRDDCVLPSIPRDASTIIGTTERGRGVCKAPTQRHLDPIGPQVLRERQGRPVYHSGGWLPSVVTTSTLVATPSVFLRDKAFWCIRPLTRKEVLGALGVPELSLQVLSNSTFAEWDLIHPVHILQRSLQLFEAIPSCEAEDYTGGGSFSSPPPLHRQLVHITGQKRPRTCNEEDKESELEDERRRVLRQYDVQPTLGEDPTCVFPQGVEELLESVEDSFYADSIIAIFLNWGG